ncbi:MAG: L-fuculose-phosphate aldolase [Lachnospiraceae bacterium]
MLLQKEREAVVEYGKTMFSKGLTNGTTGNISVFNREEGLMAISPSGIDYFSTAPEDVVIMKLDGTIADGIRKPSSEVHLHSEVYKSREDVSAVVHTHSDNSTIMACLNWPLPSVHYMLAAVSGTEVPCAKYATFGSQELALNAVEAMGVRKACFLANHGLLVCDVNLGKALALAEKVEWIAGLYLRTKALGEPVILSDDEMARVAERAKSYGQPKK